MIRVATDPECCFPMKEAVSAVDADMTAPA
jgi:hypothetical protein